MRKREDMHIYGQRECPTYTSIIDQAFDTYSNIYSDYFTIKMHHSGEWNEYMTVYKYGKIDYFDCCNVDKISLIEIQAMHTECCEFKGGQISFWYKTPTTSILEDLTDLLHDVDVMKMTRVLDRKLGIMEVYVTVCRPLNVEGLPIQSSISAKDVVEENLNDEAVQDTSEENGDESDVSWHEDSSNLDETDDDIHFEAYVDQDEVGQDDNRKQTSQYDDASTDWWHHWH
ncbi:hypothetical protein ACET3Z_019299 [Daucus carota]